ALSRDAHAAPSPERALSQARHVCASQMGFSAGHWLLVVHSGATSEASPSGSPPSDAAQVNVAAPSRTQTCPDGQSVSCSQCPALSLLSLHPAVSPKIASTVSPYRASIKNSRRARRTPAPCGGSAPPARTRGGR